MSFDKLVPPKKGEKITIQADKLDVPNQPIIPIIKGDGIGPDVMNAMQKVLDAAVQKTYSGKKALVWFEIPDRKSVV
jgi:isocitrate dehydrogenase